MTSKEEDAVIRDLVHYTIIEQEKRKKYFGRCPGCEPYIGEVKMYSTLHKRLLTRREIDRAVKDLIGRGYVEVAEIKGKRRLSKGGYRQAAEESAFKNKVGKVPLIDALVFKSIEDHYVKGEYLRKSGDSENSIENLRLYFSSEDRILKPSEVRLSVKRLLERGMVIAVWAKGVLVLKTEPKDFNEEL